MVGRSILNHTHSYIMYEQKNYNKYLSHILRRIDSENFFPIYIDIQDAEKWNKEWTRER